jgi:cytochrome c oxidase subunit 2
MVVPVETTVILRIRSQDVAHSWWIPKLGPKFDAIPGYTNRNWFKIPKPGVFRGQCAELCGRNHANMVASVRAIPAAEYQAWVTRQKQLIQQANQLAVQQRKSQSPIPG